MHAIVVALPSPPPLPPITTPKPLLDLRPRSPFPLIITFYNSMYVVAPLTLAYGEILTN